ncbi:DUF1285 domain-containing protein [Salinarimonas soli]|uniref:DUF1285 domain-containing protein n=1 Tax=Salinarimonas soli TaxID=1638099 RepID=A0A5B2VDB5_9HYPH|nr:DUF1285 domain-containing protein [Salinarimonas soli]KAA2236402.1 DUF1285 domain-containing protein [Salinarimonas soli]
MVDISKQDPNGLSRLAESLGAIAKTKGIPPVERWNPDFCGDIDMRIAADGTWFYGGTPIGRPALVRLFSTILRKDPDRYVLVTPVERVGIVVEDAPFVAVQMAVEGEGASRTIAMRTNVDDVIAVGADHPLRFERDDHDGVKPYVRVRHDLWARVTRALTYDLVGLGEERDGVFGLAAGGTFFPIAPASELGSEA